jgi:hypothetical protein
MPTAVTGGKLCVLPQDVTIDWSWQLKSVVFSVRREINFLRSFYRHKSSKLPRRKRTSLQKFKRMALLQWYLNGHWFVQFYAYIFLRL